MDKHIAGMKKPHHNIYGLNSFAFKVIVALCIALWLLLFLDVHIRHLSLFAQITVWVVTLLVVPFITFMCLNRKKDIIVPYCRKDDFEFLGLYNLKDSNLDNRHDILARDEEISYMHQVLEDIIFPQKTVKQALCITGPSGSGKSIILNFFKQAYKDEYKIFDFSGNDD